MRQRRSIYGQRASCVKFLCAGATEPRYFPDSRQGHRQIHGPCVSSRELQPRNVQLRASRGFDQGPTAGRSEGWPRRWHLVTLEQTLEPWVVQLQGGGAIGAMRGAQRHLEALREQQRLCERHSETARGPQRSSQATECHRRSVIASSGSRALEVAIVEILGRELGKGGGEAERRERAERCGDQVDARAD